MAVDDALLSAFVPGVHRPILRLASWLPACLSLGYAQPLAGVDLAACASAGVAVVRRSSGGRAVLHDRDLVYAVIAAADDPTVGGSIAATYRAIARGVLAGVQALGVPVVLATGTPAGDAAARRTGACFAATTRSEVVWNHRKLVGSAQVRRGGVVLQHGSVRLVPSGADVPSLLHCANRRRVADHLARATATVADVTGVTLAPAAAAARFGDAFATALAVDLAPDTLSPGEAAAATALRTNRYGSPDWTALR
jgi:lipoate-protein ligase A